MWAENIIETLKLEKKWIVDLEEKKMALEKRRGDEACLWSRRLIVCWQDRARSWAHTGKRKRIFGVYRRGDGESLSQRHGETFAINLEKTRTPTFQKTNQTQLLLDFLLHLQTTNGLTEFMLDFKWRRLITILWGTLAVLRPAAGVSNIPKVSCFRGSWFSFSCLFSQVITEEHMLK